LHIVDSANGYRTPHLPRADQETSRLHREYVRLVVERTGKPPTRIAKELGIAPSTLTRLLREPEGSSATLHGRTVRMLEDYSSIPFGSGVEHPGGGTLRGFHEEAVPFDAKSADPELSAALKALIAGRKNAVPWTIRTRSLERVGFMPGDIVIVDLNRQPESGDVVCAQVYDWRRGSAETVMRLYEPPYLVAASLGLDEALRRPLVVDNNQVLIKGVVLPHRLRPGLPA
jgi:hypothetical protein